MSRELRRLLVAPERLAAMPAGDGSGGLLDLEPEEAHYLERVLRYRPGERLAVVDGCGRLWTAVLEPQGRLRLEQPPQTPRIRQEAPWPPLLLAMAVPKREADLVWRMATELGADRLQPLLASRGAPGERCPLPRWEGIVREATEQCERLWRPSLMAPQPAEAWLGRPFQGIALLATTRREGLPLCGGVLGELVDREREAALRGGLHLAIGPEGGWSPQEEQAAEAAGWRPVSLGESILRTATAAVSGLALLAHWRALSCASCRQPSP
ncbi:16S rRNA (uracil(1498)-N(3))-methyltransferase [Synechococcus sp. CCY 9618]|uniref:16S rRNA (uracil(1498)-N(3))-methyltransferase n=1 Tax=Synechococcus sp. CCY 9618 TaxID=2815602 RepID=UPI001C21371A|nr:16S rRNA (uracil(1498)-N(3))-methyltransferase [Synechococcus sp. CCY 9618]